VARFFGLKRQWRTAVFSEPAASGRALPHVITGQLPTSVFRDSVIANETMATAISGGFERSGSDRVLRFLRTLATTGQSPLPKNAERPAPNRKRRRPILQAPCLRIMSHLQFADMFRRFALLVAFPTRSLFPRNRTADRPQSWAGSRSNFNAS